MTFTYNISSTDPSILNISRVRLLIGDTVLNAGPLPNNVNLSDEEILAIISIEGTWQAGAAGCMELLAARWANAVDVRSDGATKSQSQQAQAWLASAARQRANVIRSGMLASGGSSVGLSVNATYADEVSE